MKKMHRRGFLGRISALSAAVGATLAGVIPELGAATTTAPTDGGGTPVPPMKALPSADVVSFYSAALGDLDILKLASLVRQPNRIDPPTSSGDVTTPEGTRIRSVSMPVSSTVDGSVAAYLVYGRMDMKLEQGVHTIHYRIMVTPDGKVRGAHAGQVVPSPKPEWNELLLANFFPDVYRRTLSGVPMSQGVGPVSDAGEPAARKAAWFPYMRKTQQGPNPQLALCLHNCLQQYNACWGTFLGTLGQGGVIALACIGCIIINGGTLGKIPPELSRQIARACWAVCSISAGLLANALTVLRQCQRNYDTCVESCHNIFGARQGEIAI